MAKQTCVWIKLLLIGTLALSLLTGCTLLTPSHQPEPLDEEAEDPAPSAPPSLESLAQEDVLRAGIPPEYSLPWEDSEAFQAAATHNNAPIRLAAFRAVLPDPFESELENIALAASKLAGTVVPPGGVFSQNQQLGPYNEAKGYLPGPNYVGGKVVVGTGGGVCKISTLLYNLTVLSNLPIVSRREHSMIVPYVPPGQDATVTYSGGVDYRFRNDTSGPILIWSQMEGKTLYMALYGQVKPPEVEWKHEILSHTPAVTQVRTNNKLSPGESRVVFEGFDAYTVRSWAVITEEDGSQRTRDLGTSRYQSIPRLVEQGPQS